MARNRVVAMLCGRMVAAGGVVVCAFAIVTMTAGDATAAEIAPAVERAVSDDAAVAGAAVAELRAQGPAGLAALLERHREMIAWAARTRDGARAAGSEVRSPLGAPSETAAGSETRPTTEDDVRLAAWRRLSAAIDAVSAQRDGHSSRLYWHTRLDDAIAAARREKKPILSSRLLGRLTDEFSCANSRYFRAALYANREIGDLLRERFVLHWASERPAPKVTIDFGDGRRLERTVTGNSIHYVLDEAGRPVDALPGLYGPQAFLRELEAIRTVWSEIPHGDDAARNRWLATYHQSKATASLEAWRRELTELGINVPAPAPGANASVTANANTGAGQGTAPQPAAAKGVGAPKRVDAARAAPRAMGKSLVEIPLLARLALSPAAALRQATTDEVWISLGQRRAADAVLDEASRRFMIRQLGLPDETPLGGGAGPTEETFAALVANFQRAMAIDTARNEYEFRRRIHEWLAASPDIALEPLNERIYAELFLTPRSDPWLGLVDPETYTGFERGGVHEAPAPASGPSQATDASQDVAVGGAGGM